MNKEELIRTLAARAADAVVLLEKIWPDNDAFPAKLCDRVDASDYFITNRGAVIASDLRVPFLAEQVGAVGISSADVHTRWKIVAIYQSDIRFTYAVRTTAWDKKPRFPGLDLSDREVDIVYEMCDTLSRNRAYIEKDFSTEKTLFADILSNTHAAKLLGAFDESRFIELLQNDPLALPVLEAVLLAGVWSESTLESVPNFLMVFALPNAQALSVRENLEDHFHTVDLLRSPSAPFERPLTLRLENSQPPVYSPAASGRLVLLEPIGDAPRKLLIDTIEQHSRIRLLTSNAEARPFAAFPIVISTHTFPAAYAYTVTVPKQARALRESDADCLRLAAAKLLCCISGAAGTLNEAIDDLAGNPHAYRLNLPERWITIARQFIRHALLTNENSRAAFDRISGEAERVAKEAQLSRAETIEKGVAFLLEPERYKDAIHPRPQSLEELAETTAFEYTYQNEPLLVYHPDRFAGLLQRAGVGPELVEDVVQALKDRSLCTSEKVKINTEGAGRRYLAIPTKKFINSSIPSIPAGNEEDNNV